MNSSHPQKEDFLRQHGCLHPHPERVTDELFQDSEFFDPRDLVLVKYEMLRCVRVEGCSVTEAARRFGFSRPAFYQIRTAWQQHGMPGLLPQRPGPRTAHKLNDEVLAVIDTLLADDPKLSSAELAGRLLDEPGLAVHPRSIERALARRKKGAR
jgi:transposase